MKIFNISIGLSVLLMGCTPGVNTFDTATNLATDLKDNVYATSKQVKDWAMTPTPKPAPNEVADSYCYYVLQDIICYHQPMDGVENRLVAYQGTHAKPPSPATMELLPKQKEDDSSLPANRVANSKPVFTTLPTLPKEGDKSSDQAQPVDSSHEILSDPALAPEL